ncbi:MAG: DUF460 domain-containing protein [Candidatus Bathyarchaeia archaeon]
MVSERVRKLIVGVDPGLNCALAILSLDGALLLLESHREWPPAKIIERIVEFGEPTVISSDVSPAPSLLEMLSRKLNAILFEPAIPMSSDEKQRLAKIYAERYGVNPKNIHEVDALAAAIKAYNYYKNKFDQVEAKLRDLGYNVPPDLVKDLVARGYSVARAIRVLLEKDARRGQSVMEKPHGEERLKETVRRLMGKLMLERERNRILREANRELHMKIRELETEIESLRETLEKIHSEETVRIRREREYQRLLEEIRFLRDRVAEQEIQIESYKRMLSHLQRISEGGVREGLILLKPIESFTREGLERAFKIYDVRVGDIVLILDPSGGGPATAKNLVTRGIKAAIVKGKMSHNALEVFEEYSVPIIPAEKVNIMWVDGLPYADQEEVKRLIREHGPPKSSNPLGTLKSIIDEHLREVKGEG